MPNPAATRSVPASPHRADQFAVPPLVPKRSLVPGPGQRPGSCRLVISTSPTASGTEISTIGTGKNRPASSNGINGLSGISGGPDGNVWYAGDGSNKIGRVNVKTAAFAEFVIPTAGVVPAQIATGSDGNLWFTEETANRIGRLTP